LHGCPVAKSSPFRTTLSDRKHPTPGHRLPAKVMSGCRWGLHQPCVTEHRVLTICPLLLVVPTTWKLRVPTRCRPWMCGPRVRFPLFYRFFFIYGTPSGRGLALIDLIDPPSLSTCLPWSAFLDGCPRLRIVTTKNCFCRAIGTTSRFGTSISLAPFHIHGIPCCTASPMRHSHVSFSLEDCFARSCSRVSFCVTYFFYSAKVIMNADILHSRGESD
jgi:hypothetical protein